MADLMDSKQLRKFGFAFTGGMTLLGSLLTWRDKAPGPYVLGFAGLVLLTTLVAPRALGPLELVLRKLLIGLTSAITFVVLTLLYFLAITPLGLIMRLLGKDLLSMRFDAKAKSYWVDVDPEGPTSRADAPY